MKHVDEVRRIQKDIVYSQEGVLTGNFVIAETNEHSSFEHRRNERRSWLKFGDDKETRNYPLLQGHGTVSASLSKQNIWPSHRWILILYINIKIPGVLSSIMASLFYSDIISVFYFKS